MEGRDISTFDMLEAFMQVDMDEDILDMNLEATIDDLLAKMEPKLYRKYVRITNTDRLKKVLYCHLHASLFFWKHLTGIRQDLGFKVNPYGQYVGNTIIGDKSCMIIWHADDLKMSIFGSDAKAEIIKKL